MFLTVSVFCARLLRIGEVGRGRPALWALTEELPPAFAGTGLPGTLWACQLNGAVAITTPAVEVVAVSEFDL